MSGRRLATHVHVRGVVYGPDSDVPPEVAEKISNPKAWADEPTPAQPASADVPKTDAKPAATARRSAPRSKTAAGK